MQTVRSLLFVPANNRDWVKGAPGQYPADGFIFDLEDAVPPAEKEAARDNVRASYQGFADTDAVITARVNPQPELLEADLDRIVHPRLDAILLPKLARPEEVTYAANVLEYLEHRREIDNSVEILALPETAEGFYQAYELGTASERVVSVVGATTPGGDINRALGFDWTRQGLETLHMRSKVLMESRAAGCEQFISGLWSADVNDLDGLREEAQFTRQLGYSGYMVIHPSHVEPVNEIFTPDDDEIEFARRIIKALEQAETEGKAATTVEGEMVDIADRQAAEQKLKRARDLGLID